jgi:hypothetical protein
VLGWRANRRWKAEAPPEMQRLSVMRTDGTHSGLPPLVVPALFLACALLGFTNVALFGDQGATFDWIRSPFARLGVALCDAGLLGWSYALYRKYNASRHRGQQRDPHTIDCLVLRAGAADTQEIGKGRWLQTEMVSTIVNACQPFGNVAYLELRRASERTPVRAKGGTVVSDANWMGYVERVIENAATLVLVSGVSDGLVEETRMIEAARGWDRVLIVNASDGRYRDFAAAVAAVLGSRQLPALPERCVVALLDDTPRGLIVRHALTYSSELSENLLSSALNYGMQLAVERWRSRPEQSSPVAPGETVQVDAAVRVLSSSTRRKGSFTPMR